MEGSEFYGSISPNTSEEDLVEILASAIIKFNHHLESEGTLESISDTLDIISVWCANNNLLEYLSKKYEEDNPNFFDEVRLLAESRYATQIR